MKPKSGKTTAVYARRGVKSADHNMSGEIKGVRLSAHTKIV